MSTPFDVMQNLSPITTTFIGMVLFLFFLVMFWYMSFASKETKLRETQIEAVKCKALCLSNKAKLLKIS